MLLKAVEIVEIVFIMKININFILNIVKIESVKSYCPLLKIYAI